MRSIRMLSAFSARHRSSRKVGDAAVLDSGFGLELERRDHRAGVDLRDLPVHFELGVFFGEHLRQQLQFVGIHRLLLVGALQQTARRQLVSAGDARHRRLGLVVAVAALSDLRIYGSSRCDGGLRQNSGCRSASGFVAASVGSGSRVRSMPVRRGSGATRACTVGSAATA